MLVPVLWDRQSRRIVNNESFDIAVMLNEAFDAVGADRGMNLCPPHLRAEIDALGVEIAQVLRSIVYSGSWMRE